MPSPGAAEIEVGGQTYRLSYSGEAAAGSFYYYLGFMEDDGR